MTGTPRLEARDLVVHRGPVAILHGVSIALGEGEALALVGPNAAGKSTLVRALAGLLPARAGEVRVEGRALASWPRDALARAVALVTPDDEGAPLTVRERVALGRFPHRGPFRALTREDEAAVEKALERTDIQALAHRTLRTLSAGERQLAALARGLAQEPRVLLLDEPAAHLDVGHQLRLFRVLDEVRRESGVSVLAVVHDLPRAAAWAERMVLMGHGRVLAEGAPHAVLSSSACAQAFAVVVGVHRVDSVAHPLYSFREPGR